MSTEKTIIKEIGITEYIDKDAMSTVYDTGNIVEVVTPKNPSTSVSNYRNLGNNQSVNIQTGEVFDHKPNAMKQKQNLNKSFAYLRRLVNCNIVGDPTELHLVLTYANDMYDAKKLKSDFKNFWLRFKYCFPSLSWLYISIFEPQVNGRWHIHVLLKSDEPVYLDYNKVRELWGLGRVHISPVPFADNFGAYFTKDMALSDRQKNYPSGFRCYTCSQNVKRPVTERLSYKKAIEIVENCPLLFSQTVHVKDGSQVLNTIFYEQYKKK